MELYEWGGGENIRGDCEGSEYITYEPSFKKKQRKKKVSIKAET